MLSGRGWCWFVVVVGAAVILAGAGVCAGGVRADGVVVWLTYCAALVSNQILCNLILTYRYQPLIASLIKPRKKKKPRHLSQTVKREIIHIESGPRSKKAAFAASPGCCCEMWWLVGGRTLRSCKRRHQQCHT